MQRKMDMIFGTWNVRSLCRAGSLTTVKVDRGEIGWGSTDWIHLDQDRGQWGGPCEHEPSSFVKCWEILEQLSNWWFL
jgi:hypothetical protein